MNIYNKPCKNKSSSHTNRQLGHLQNLSDMKRFNFFFFCICIKIFLFFPVIRKKILSLDEDLVF